MAACPLFLRLVSGLIFAALLLPAQPPKPTFTWPQGKRVAVSFSFDDARLSQIDTGMALLARHKAKATFYVSPANMQRRLDGWKKAAAAGQEIGNHSASHSCSGNFPFSVDHALENFTLTTMEKDLDSASVEIERQLGVKPLTFAYPCGQKFVGRGLETKSYVPLVATRFLAGRGFRDEAANDPAFVDPAQLMGIDSDGMTFEQMKTLTADAAKRGGWLVFAGHEMGKSGRQTTLVDSLEQYLTYAADPANGVWLDTVAAVAKYVIARQ
jgi:peptidoglycan/xylan/chitin deacetylase (PgdA/CDA1 family)